MVAPRFDRPDWHFEYGTRRWTAIASNEPMYGPADHVPVRGWVTP